MFIISFFIFLSCLSISGPKDETVGCIIGKMKFTLTRDWIIYSSGSNSNNITISLVNKETGKSYNSSVNKDFYYFINLPEGEYYFQKYLYKIQYNKAISYYTMYFPKGTDIYVKSKTITIMDYFQSTATPVGNDLSVEFNTINPDIDEMKLYFQDMDEKGLWYDYNFRTLNSFPST